MGITDEILILSGTANPQLSEDVVKNLGLKLGNMEIRKFADGETFVQIEETVRNKDTYIIQPTGRPSSSENWMELYCIIDALKRASAKRITAVIPYYGYSRQDRKNEPRVPITAKLVANLLSEAGAHRVLALDLHAAQIQGFFDIPVDHMLSKNVFLDKIRKDLDMSNSIIVSPDIGGVGRARAIAKQLNLDIAIIDKRRDRANECEVMNIIGDVNGKDAIIIAFEYAFIYKKAQESNLNTEVTKVISKLLGKDVLVIFIIKDKWQRVRQEFLNDRQKKQQSKEISEQNVAVDQAKKIFGENNIEIIND